MFDNVESSRKLYILSSWYILLQTQWHDGISSPESLVIHALIAKEIVLEIKLSEVGQVVESTYRDFLQFVALLIQSRCYGH